MEGVRKVNRVDESWQQLIVAAKQAMERAYVPYSRFQVGAALRTTTGEIVTGCNIENASYGLTNCAERTALFRAYAQGSRDFTAMVVVARSDGPVSPCGACRQVILELYPRGAPILLTNMNDDFLWTTSDKLLPHGFKDFPGSPLVSEKRV